MPSNSTPKEYYVYILARPDGRPFYVGKGSGTRVHRHEEEARRACGCHKCRVIRKVWKQGDAIQRYIVLTTPDEQEALAYEVELIAMYGQNTLTNGTRGGDGVASLDSKTESRKRIKIRASLRAAWKRGRNEFIPSEVWRAKLSASHKERLKAPEERAKLTKAAEARWAKPGAQERAVAQLEQRWSDPEAHRKVSDAMKKQWADPEVRARRSAAQKASWQRRKQQQDN